MCREAFDSKYLPGEQKSGAYGYHSDTGMLYDMTGSPEHTGYIFGTGDTVGCYVYQDGPDRKIRFTLNGDKLGE